MSPRESPGVLQHTAPQLPCFCSGGWISVCPQQGGCDSTGSLAWPRRRCCHLPSLPPALAEVPLPPPLSQPRTTPLLSCPRALRAASLPLPSGHRPAARPHYKEGRHFWFYVFTVGPLLPTHCLANSRHSEHLPIKLVLLGSRRQLSCLLLRGPASNFGSCGMKEMDWVPSLCTGTPQGALDRS